jgi:hypothetical protein
VSGFLRNLALRAAGLTPAAGPVTKTVIPEPAIVEEPVVEEAEVVAEPLLVQQVTEAEEVVEPVAESETKIAVVEVHKTPVKGIDKPRREVVPRVSPPVKAEPLEPSRRADAPMEEVAPVASESPRRVEPAPVPSAVFEPSEAPQPVAPAMEEQPQPAAPVKEKELVFVNAPPLPPQIVRQVEERVREHVPAEAGRVDVHIGRIEIVQPAGPPPPAAKAPGKPRGFAEHRLERNYVSRRWY